MRGDGAALAGTFLGQCLPAITHRSPQGATTIHAALVQQYGFGGSHSAVKRLIRQVLAAEAPRVTSRLTFAPGEAAQVDFGAGPLLVDPRTGELRKTWFFVMTLCWSRHQYAEFEIRTMQVNQIRALIVCIGADLSQGRQ
ncbi:hypothetical protein ACJU26_06285 [Acidithiobacillus sp. M4-SHS-6]|uniref:hypothetical protein n=1 Tax=Acidithiobacillus sp. M4-SHS-6 TaxID=3383024 RepID=UPI0039BDE3E7